uniref:Uncharacterized protein n=1 Tax=Anopheles coluzzii TaxID=1518534 RepID=A0A8W7P5R3_ANOCL
MRTLPSAPTDANMSRPPPARENAMSYTSLSCAISCVLTWPETRLTRPSGWLVSSPQIVQVVSIEDVPTRFRSTSFQSNEHALEPGVGLTGPPQPQVVAAGREQIRIHALRADDLHLVVVLLDEAAEGEPEALVRPHRPVHRVERPWGEIFVDLLALARRAGHASGGAGRNRSCTVGCSGCCCCCCCCSSCRRVSSPRCAVKPENEDGATTVLGAEERMMLPLVVVHASARLPGASSCTAPSTGKSLER